MFQSLRVLFFFIFFLFFFPFIVAGLFYVNILGDTNHFFFTFTGNKQFSKGLLTTHLGVVECLVVVVCFLVSVGIQVTYLGCDVWKLGWE